MFTRRDALKRTGLAAGLLARQAQAAPSQFWNTKPPSEWTGDEIHRLRTESPWAKTAVVRDAYAADRSGSGRLSPAAQQWSAFPRETRHWTVIVRWESSAPIQAAARSSSDEFERFYVISVVGDARVTAFLADNSDLGNKLQLMRLNSTLEPANAKPLQVEKIEEVSHQSQRDLWFYFSRRRTVTPDAGHLYFATTIGRLEVMAKFDGDDMLYRGQLAL